MLRLVSGWILLLLSFNSLALTETRLLELSSSGETLLFDAGLHERLKEGEFGILVKRIADLDDTHSLSVVPVAKVRSVKVNTNSSIWIAFEPLQKDLLKKGDRYTLLAESNMIPGRRDYKLSKVTVVGSEGHVKKAGKNALTDEADQLARVKKYSKDYINYEPTYRSDEDFELIELEKWARHRGQRYRTGLYRSQNSEQFKRALRLEVFEGLVTSYLQKVNDPDFDYGRFYDEQMKEGNYFRKRSNFSTSWESHLAEKSKSREVNTKLARSLLEKGERWSEDYSDEELGNVLENISIAQEKDRKARVISKPARFHLAVDYGQIISDHQSKDDAVYSKSNRFALNLDLEFIPVLKHEIWERLTINAQLSSADDAIGVGSRNYDRADQSFTLGANWYPFYAPYTVSAINLYVGTYFRAGRSEISSSLYDNKGNYTLLSIPGFRVGLRYTFKNRVSLRVIGSMETTKLEKITSDKFNSELPESIAKTDMNLALGLGYSF